MSRTASAPYRIGVAGMGGRGLSIARWCDRLDSVRVVAVADPSHECQTRAAAELDERTVCYEDHRAMLAAEELDILIVATPGFAHRDATIDAATAGVRGIYVEKPLATSLADCDAMIDACDRNGTALAVGHQRRYWPEFQAVRDAVRENAIGRLSHGYTYWPTGRLGCEGTHYFDAVNMIVGQQVSWVVGKLDPMSKPPDQKYSDIIDPGGMGFIVYEDGTRIAIDAMDDVRQPWDLLLFGSRGRLFVRDHASVVQYWARDSETLDPLESHSTMPERSLQWPPSGKDNDAHGTVEAVLDLLQSIEEERPPGSSGRQGRSALEIIVAFHLSSHNGMKPIQLPLEGDALSFDGKFL